MVSAGKGSPPDWAVRVRRKSDAIRYRSRMGCWCWLLTREDGAEPGVNVGAASWERGELTGSFTSDSDSSDLGFVFCCGAKEAPMPGKNTGFELPSLRVSY